jgi:MarR family transcriptional regulator, organic hydroperoxide resistance regulator
MPAGSGSPFVLDGQLCFALHSTSRAMAGRYRPRLAGIGLTYPQYLVMLALWEQQPLSLSDLGDRLFLDSGTLSPLVKRLEAQGLVLRTRRAADERVVDVELTPAGQRLRVPAQEVQAEVEHATGLAPRDLGRLRDQLTGLAATLRAEEARPSSAVSS